MTDHSALTNYVYRIVATLAQHGVNDVVISPGSRSTPLAYAFMASKKFATYRQVDERSAGFYALGLAKSQGKPVVLLCTSGTAAANYYPAVVEAKYARVPLIVLTADRPHELREVGAPQTINQINIFGEHVKWSVDFPIADNEPISLPFIERHTMRAIQTANAAPFGPVHINVPLREPLMVALENVPLATTAVQLMESELMPSARAQHQLAELLSATVRGIVIIGELPLNTNRDYLWDLVRKLRWPVLIEALSNMRSAIPHDCLPYVITTYDALLKDAKFSKCVAPQTVLRFGAQPISKFLTNLIRNSEPENYIIIDEDARFRDSSSASTHILQAQLDDWLMLLPFEEVAIDASYTARWQQAHKIAVKHIKDYANHAQDEGAVVQKILKQIPNGSDIFVSNSMPIRDMDTFLLETTKDIRIFANRGANGIDGIVSTALGFSATSERPTYLLIGDLAFLHDSNGLLATRYQSCKLTVLVMNNDGGGIFSYLPQAQTADYYEDLFGTPTALQFEHLANMYEMQYDALTKPFAQLDGITFSDDDTLRLVECFTDRHVNVVEHRQLWARIHAELATLC